MRRPGGYDEMDLSVERWALLDSSEEILAFSPH